MKILLIGANGQVGWEVKRKALSANIEIVVPDRVELDITRYQDIKTAIHDVKPNIIVNAAAYTAVDEAEKERDIAFLVNRDGPMHLAQICADIDIPLLHISTDYVFDGENNKPYTEEDPVNPINVYGQSKLEGEEAIRKYLEKHIIVRTSWVFGVWGNNFVKTILKLTKSKNEINVVADQYGCPTPAKKIAETLLSIAHQSDPVINHSWGIYHYCGTPKTSWFELANQVVARKKEYAPSAKVKVFPVTTADYPVLARRPKCSVLNCSKVSKVFKVAQCDWQREILPIIRSDIE